MAQAAHGRAMILPGLSYFVEKMVFVKMWIFLAASDAVLPKLRKRRAASRAPKLLVPIHNSSFCCCCLQPRQEAPVCQLIRNLFGKHLTENQISVFENLFSHRYNAHPLYLGEFLYHFDYIRWLIAFTAMCGGRDIGRIGFG